MEPSRDCSIGAAVRVGLVGEVDPVDGLFLIGVPVDPVAEAQHPDGVVDCDCLGGRLRFGERSDFGVPPFEVIDEVLFEVGSEISEDHLDLGPLTLVEHPEVEFGGRRVPDAIGGEDPPQTFDEV